MNNYEQMMSNSKISYLKQDNVSFTQRNVVFLFIVSELDR